MKEKEDIRENKWDKLLKIHTMGRDDSNADQYHYPYEPTPYSVLERLANTGIIRKNNTLLDYGCGKGRVDFFLSYQTRCKSVGVEYDERIYNKAVENKESAISTARDRGISMVALGHWRSEQVGLWAIGDLISKQFSIAVEYVPIACDV